VAVSRCISGPALRVALHAAPNERFVRVAVRVGSGRARILAGRRLRGSKPAFTVRLPARAGGRVRMRLTERLRRDGRLVTRRTVRVYRICA
jgi:hypothetical protein